MEKDEMLEEIELEDTEDELLEDIVLVDGDFVKVSVKDDDYDILEVEELNLDSEDSDEVLVDALLSEGEDTLKLEGETTSTFNTEDYLDDSEEEERNSKELEALQERKASLIANSVFEKIAINVVNSRGALLEASRNSFGSMNYEKMKPISMQVYDTGIDFITVGVAANTRKNVIELQSEDDITLDFAKTLMNSLGLSKEVTDNELNYYVFLDYCKKVYKYSKGVQQRNSALNQKIKAMTASAVNTLVSDQPGLNPYALNDSKNLEKTLYKNIELKADGSIIWTCGKCGNKETINAPILTYSKVDGMIYQQPSQLVCPKCNTMNTFSTKDLKIIDKQVKPKLRNLEIKGQSLEGVYIYTPSRQDLLYSSLFTCSLEDGLFVKDLEEKLISDEEWRSAKEVWINTIKHIARNNSAKVISTGEVGVISRLLAEQNDSYQYLKEKAIATLLNKLGSYSTFGNAFSFKEIGHLKIIEDLAKNKDKNKYKLIDILNIKEGEEDTLDDEISNALSLLDKCKSLRDRYLLDLSRSCYMFSDLSISNFDLSPKLRMEFLNEDNFDLFNILSTISDYMIVGYYAEDFIKNYTPVVKRNGKYTRDLGYNLAYQRLVNLQIGLDEALSKYTKSIRKIILSSCGDRQVTYEPYWFIKYQDISNNEVFHLLSRFLLSGDYWEACRVYQMLLQDSEDKLLNLCSDRRFKILQEFIEDFPKHLDTFETSKFSYYFPELNSKEVSEEDKIKALSGISDKFTKTFSFPSIGRENVSCFIDNKFRDFVEKHYIVIVTLDSLFNQIHSDDLISYSIGKDFLLSLNKLDMDTLSNVLNVNSFCLRESLSQEFKIEHPKINLGYLIDELPFYDPNIREITESSVLSIAEKQEALEDMTQSILEEFPEGFCHDICSSFVTKGIKVI